SNPELLSARGGQGWRRIPAQDGRHHCRERSRQALAEVQDAELRAGAGASCKTAEARASAVLFFGSRGGLVCKARQARPHPAADGIFFARVRGTTRQCCI